MDFVEDFGFLLVEIFKEACEQPDWPEADPDAVLFWRVKLEGFRVSEIQRCQFRVMT